MHLRRRVGERVAKGLAAKMLDLRSGSNDVSLSGHRIGYVSGGIPRSARMLSGWLRHRNTRT